MSGDGCDDGDSVGVACNSLSEVTRSDALVVPVALGVESTGIETEPPSGISRCKSRKLPAAGAASSSASLCSGCSPSSRWSSSAFGGGVQISMPGGVRGRGEGRNSVASS
jgi:hypothetical protein